MVQESILDGELLMVLALDVSLSLANRVLPEGEVEVP
jgi:hypothetical protein